ncbi:hypothetical protein EJ06DRAFT_352781 [Trichodelitschia bisporula]|uniref:Uncharacterized protein n=1 Tax=Trichodelitschia bisporula TaxID=703511 RepID=A0A6G1I016_9PEZI|nr:hypothetical protein EJ06DRAFT_352781 [Trichodelitschia bisporula]
MRELMQVSGRRGEAEGPDTAVAGRERVSPWLNEEGGGGVGSWEEKLEFGSPLKGTGWVEKLFRPCLMRGFGRERSNAAPLRRRRWNSGSLVVRACSMRRILPFLLRRAEPPEREFGVPTPPWTLRRCLVIRYRSMSGMLTMDRV